MLRPEVEAIKSYASINYGLYPELTMGSWISREGNTLELDRITELIEMVPTYL